MKEMRRLVETKRNGKWEVSLTVTDKNEIWEGLAKDLIAKKIHKATWIKSVQDKPNYDGTRNITVTYDNNVRSIYTVQY